jgi:hypothetical protein
MPWQGSAAVNANAMDLSFEWPQGLLISSEAPDIYNADEAGLAMCGVVGNGSCIEEGQGDGGGDDN